MAQSKDDKLVNVHEAKTHFSALLVRVEAAEEIVIARAGKPIAKLVGLDPHPGPRVPGRMRGKIRIDASFDDELPFEIPDDFEE